MLAKGEPLLIRGQCSLRGPNRAFRAASVNSAEITGAIIDNRVLLAFLLEKTPKFRMEVLHRDHEEAVTVVGYLTGAHGTLSQNKKTLSAKYFRSNGLQLEAHSNQIDSVSLQQYRCAVKQISQSDQDARQNRSARRRQ